MTKVRTNRSRRLIRLTVDSMLIAGALIVLASPSGSSAASVFLPASSYHPLSNESSHPLLRVDPSSFWMHSGENVTLRSVWSTGSPFCSATPLWYRWTTGNASANGFLNDTNSSSTLFTAESFVSRTGIVELRSAIAVVCGSNRTVVEATSTSNISVVVTLVVSVLTLHPEILSPGENATLEGIVRGGEPPYVVVVVWGDGASVAISLSDPGPFSEEHSFSTGTFLPYARVNDAAGDLANESVDESVSVGTDSFRVVLLPGANTTEVGGSVDFSGILLDAPHDSVILYDCSNATVGPSSGPSPNANTTVFSCDFHAPGIQAVAFGAYSPYPGGPSATTVLYETVVAAPSVIVSPVRSAGEVGGPLAVRIAIAGGAPPLSLSWNLSGNRSAHGLLVDSDGVGVVVLPLTLAGLYTVDVRVNDSLGGFAGDTSTVVRVNPQLSAGATGGDAIVSAGADAAVAGEVNSGCSPFTWWAVPSITPSTESSETGTMPEVDGFSWNGTYDLEGNLSVDVGVADGCGAIWRTNLAISLLPELSIVANVTSPSSAPNDTLDLNVTIRGGWPPFALFANASDNESWNRTVTEDGAFGWLLNTTANGTVTLRITVVDSLGVHRQARCAVTLETRPAGPSSPPPTPPPLLTGPTNNSSSNATVSDVLGLFVSGFALAALALGSALLWRRRVRRAKGLRGESSPDPEGTLRHIIEPAEGAERFTVELLAEEAGIPLPVVRSTIDRLVSEGKVRSEAGADGEEVLSWASESGG